MWIVKVPPWGNNVAFGLYSKISSSLDVPRHVEIIYTHIHQASFNPSGDIFYYQYKKELNNLLSSLGLYILGFMLEEITDGCVMFRRRGEGIGTLYSSSFHYRTSEGHGPQKKSKVITHVDSYRHTVAHR